MKKLSFLLVTLFCLPVFISKAQENPVKWVTSYQVINANEGEIVITANIEKKWHIYSQRPTDAGPIATSFSFTPSKQYTTVNKTEELNAHEEFDKAFDTKIYVFNDKAEFRQKIKLTGKGGFIIPFKVEFMCCNDMMCLPPKTVELSVMTK